MTSENFKNWLEGFVQGIGGTPTKEQWDMIVGQLKTVHDYKDGITYYQYNTNYPYPGIVNPWKLDVICSG